MQRSAASCALPQLCHHASRAGTWSGDKKHGPGQYFYVSRGKTYIGEWVEDVAACGEMRELSEAERSSVDLHASPSNAMLSPLLSAAAALGAAGGNSNSSSAAHMGVRWPGSTPLPVIGLADAHAVFAEAVAEARAAAAASATGLAASSGEAGAHGMDAYGHAGGLVSEVSPLYMVEAESLELAQDELLQLMQAFRLGDALGSGSIPADLPTLMEVLGGLGIAASHGDAAALLRELMAQESEYVAVGGGGVDTVCFPNFASCMARLRD